MNRIITTLAVSVAVGFSALLGQGAPPDLVPLAISEFSFDNEDWRQSNEGQATTAPLYFPNGGISGGGISASGGKDWFIAPAKFLGTMNHAYGGKLRFSLRQGKSSGFSRVYDIRLHSGGLRLANYFPQSPPLNWTTFEYTLLENTGWVNRDAGRPATRDEMLAVLSQLDAIWIRARWSSATDNIASLDQVELLGPTSGPTQPELGLQRLPVVTVQGEVGVRYSIEFRNALDESTPWTRLTDVVLAFSPYLYVDTSATGQPTRFYRVVAFP